MAEEKKTYKFVCTVCGYEVEVDTPELPKEDAATPAKILYEFAKKADKLELKAGVVDGTYYDEKTIQVVATIPSREVLLGRLFGSMQSPVTNLARVLKQIAEKDEAPAAEA